MTHENPGSSKSRRKRFGLIELVEIQIGAKLKQCEFDIDRVKKEDESWSESDGISRSPSKMSLVEASDLKTFSTPIKQSKLSSDTYVLSIVPLPDLYAASASAPSNVVDLFDKASLQGVQTLPGHKDAITSLQCISTIAGATRPCLITSGKDGTVQCWDERSNAPSLKMTTAGKTRALLSCSVSQDGMTVAAGTEFQADDTLIIYWDPRNPIAPLRTHASTHSDDITSLHFGDGNLLLSGSTDGLISISNTKEQDEDEAVIHVGNWGCSISQCGWYTSREGKRNVWAASDMETFSTWSHELDPIQSIDIRSPSIHSQSRTWATDYLISATPSPQQDLNIFVGSNEGDIAHLTQHPWTLHNLWTNGHVGIVRSLLWDQSNGVILTGGEDSKLNAWRAPDLGERVSSPLGKRDAEGLEVQGGKRSRVE